MESILLPPAHAGHSPVFSQMKSAFITIFGPESHLLVSKEVFLKTIHDIKYIIENYKIVYVAM